MIHRSTASKDYLRCPAYWAHRDSGLRPLTWGKGEVSAALGVAIHHGTAILDELDDRMAGLDDTIQSSIRIFEYELAQYIGEPSTQVASELIRKAPKYIADMVLKYGEENPIDAAGLDILAVEKKYIASTIDRVVQDRETGEIGILDLKTKQFATNPDYWRDNFVRGFGKSWQMQQYMYEYRTSTGIAVNEFYLMLGDINKRQYTIHPYAISDAGLETWYNSASQIWQDMDAVKCGERTAYRVEDHTMFGRLCPYYRACFQGDSMEHYTKGESCYTARSDDGYEE